MLRTYLLNLNDWPSSSGHGFNHGAAQPTTLLKLDQRTVEDFAMKTDGASVLLRVASPDLAG
jgi:hypothetical protein